MTQIVWYCKYVVGVEFVFPIVTLQYMCLTQCHPKVKFDTTLIMKYVHCSPTNMTVSIFQQIFYNEFGLVGM